MSEAKHTKTPWGWADSDGSMVTLGTVGSEMDEGHVLTCHVCSSCEKSGNRCMMPSKRDMEFIRVACNSHDQLLEACKAGFGVLTEPVTMYVDQWKAWKREVELKMQAAIAAAEPEKP